MSLPRPHGLYLVQFIGYGESGSLGDLYATRKGHRQSVGLDPNTPEFHGQQVLLVEPASREDPDVHAISFAPEESWSYKSENPVPGEPIVLGRPKGFRMQRSERSQGRHIFTSIAPEEQPTGATLYVGAGEHQRELTLVPIPVVPDAPPAPLWELKPLDVKGSV
ncbi:peptidase inhibitor clitocypin domain-containing protein [Rhizoctonia solani AG-1 IA]|uniref:Peptidase inhibitor clitocypin domain-containing protein n=1 Tax=Thanatephorus cucumeris (strain AG1-IA) TaxID=983506 RepID=L8WTB1_THACA|nr:peptidase inhibitor clitocypin domain-containing protein [Rhizoctonia solani AG-1 IA]